MTHTPTRIVRRAPDDTEHLVPADPTKQSGLIHTIPHFPSEMRNRALDSFLALQLGLWQILSALDIFSIDVEALLVGKFKSRKFEFKRIFFDWAEMKNERQPNNSVVIRQTGPTVYTYPGRETSLDEDTLDQFCPGTLLKTIHTSEVTMELVTWMTNKDDRGGVRRALEHAFDEPEDERAGRRVLIDPYYARTARYSLESIDYPDSEAFAQNNTWPLVAMVKCDIDVVKLVKSPGILRRAAAQVVTTTDEINE